ncbi:MAG TPA: SpoIID/LytB domain-containing protein [Nitrospirota bacterium]
MQLKNHSFILAACIAVLSFPGTSRSSENIRVAIADNQPSVALASAAGLIVVGAASGADDKRLTFSPASVGARPVRVRSAGDFTQVNGRSYRGWVELRKKKSGLIIVINDLDLEDYLQGVIASEVPHAWEFEALKAQAVAARTYALYRKRTAGTRVYHILATVNSQVYNGGGGERLSAIKAVRDTKGLVIVYRGEIIPAFYHSNCGGHTEDAAELWGIDAPYLKGVDCECQEIVKDELWEKRVNTAAVAGALRRAGHQVGEISDMRIEAITPAGRVKRVVVQTGGGTVSVSGEALRTALGKTVIPSAFFELELAGNETVISGRGNGHGVGLCQWGAKEMAQEGYDFQAILSHYYPGTSLTRLK